MNESGCLELPLQFAIPFLGILRVLVDSPECHAEIARRESPDTVDENVVELFEFLEVGQGEPANRDVAEVVRRRHTKNGFLDGCQRVGTPNQPITSRLSMSKQSVQVLAPAIVPSHKAVSSSLGLT
jgi:hypothetical protein